MAKAIGTLGTIDTITIGGRVFTDMTNIIILGGYNTTASRFATLRKLNGTAGYQVTTGKTMTLYAASVFTANAGNNFAQVLYGDTDVGMNAAAAPTNAVYNIGDAAYFSLFYGVAASGAAASSIPTALNFQVPATKYAALSGNQSNTYSVVYAYEA